MVAAIRARWAGTLVVVDAKGFVAVSARGASMR